MLVCFRRDNDSEGETDKLCTTIFKGLISALNGCAEKTGVKPGFSWRQGVDER
jgi:hypothetical protein